MICSANSERQINAITEEIIDKEEENKYEVKRIEGKEGGKWDIDRSWRFDRTCFPCARTKFYNLEKLWSDAPLVDLSDGWINIWLMKHLLSFTMK